MKVTANTAEMITHLTARYGQSDVAARARLLGWLKIAEETVCGLRDWWFLRESQNFTMTTNVRSYTLDAAVFDVFQILPDTGNPLSYTPWKAYSRVVLRDSERNTPRLWSLHPPSSGRQLILDVWPVPSADVTATMIAGVRANDLADSVGSVSRIPEEWRNVLIASVHLAMSNQEGQVEAAAEFRAEYDGYLARMEAEDNKREKAMRL